MAALSGSIQLLSGDDATLTALGSPWIPLAGQPFIVTDLQVFGFGDGTTNYASLPKVPIVTTLAAILAISGSTGGNPITSASGDNSLVIDDTMIQFVHSYLAANASLNFSSGNAQLDIASGNVYIKLERSGLRALYDALNGHDFYGAVRYNSETATRVPYLDSNKKLTSSSITPTELGYLSGVASSIQSQLDALRTGQFWKAAVRAATTAAGTLATDFENGDTIDGVVLATGDRILIKDQATGSENGIYVVNASGAPTRATDFDAQADNIAGATVGVQEGTVNERSKWTCSTLNPISVGSTSITFVDAGSTAYTGTTNRITVTGNQIDISSVFENLLLKAANNLSDIANAATARTNLGLAIGSNVQAYSAILAAIAGLTLSNDDFLQVKSGAVSNRTPEQVVADLASITGFGKWGRSVIKSTSQISHTGTVTETKLFSQLIPAGTFSANDIFNFLVYWGGTSNANSKTIRAYWNTSDSLSGATLIATHVITSSAQTTGFGRCISFESISSQRLNSPSTSYGLDTSPVAGNQGTTGSVDFTSSAYYFILSIELANSGDTGRIHNASAKIIR